MDVRIFDDPGRFAQQAGAFFEFDPFTTSVIAVQVQGALGGTRPISPEDRWWIVAEAGQVVGVAMHTPPHGLFVARMPSLATMALARSMSDTGRPLPGVNGEIGTVESFAAAWKNGTGQTSSTTVSMRMYLLRDLIAPVGVAGYARAASPEDVGSVSSWLAAFRDEAQPHAPRQDWVTLAHQRVATGQFQLWEDDDQVVSMAGFSEPVAGVARVGPVYTPPAHRNRGYGAAVTARASAIALSGGATHVVLYTDLSNPTSNAIYQAIGYHPHHDAEERTFT